MRIRNDELKLHIIFTIISHARFKPKKILYGGDELEPQKRVMAIHDISCVGRCSLTVALPLLSAAGINAAVVPTAVLSTHTGGFTDFTYRDLSDDLLPIARHWKSLGLSFDAIYSGYLASTNQIAIIAEIFDMFKTESNMILIDPVMGDNGRLYSAYTPDMAAGMKKLCAKADIIVPNLTEAALLLDEKYVETGYDHKYIERLLIKLSKTGAKAVVLTGVSYEENKIGAAGYDADNGEFFYSFCEKAPDIFHGTGDIFASVLLAALLKNFSLERAIRTAVLFTQRCVILSEELNQEKKYGVCFEKATPYLLELLSFPDAAED